MEKRKLTEQDLIDNPELVEQGLKAGDEIEIPEPELTEKENVTATDGQSADTDTGGSAPPPNKERG